MGLRSGKLFKLTTEFIYCFYEIIIYVSNRLGGVKAYPRLIKNQIKQKQTFVKKIYIYIKISRKQMS